ncbi:NAD(+) diphosphatase [Micromonospora pisi]|uniref:NAD(+) diphosphatase n=1 Tax=Micromonospora pisi TaxID=589240 RepID=UPI000EB228E4|nr:NAD(+) diphosphatase [Micromonospora pisi]
MADPDGPPLARTTLDRAAHRRDDPEWLARAWEQARVLVVDIAGGGRALVGVGPGRPTLLLLAASEVPEGTSVRLFLGVEPDGTPVFAVDGPLPVVPETRIVSLREVGHLLTDSDAGLFTTAVALGNWHARHAYSSITGLPTTVTDAGWTRVDESGAHIWPRTDPAMIVLVHDGKPGPDGRCLLGNNAAWRPHDGVRRFSCLAGYVEPGESAEAAVHREVSEEVGIGLDHVEYAGSQAWPFPGSLMLGFLAHADPAQPVRVDPAEIAFARWFTRREIADVLAGTPVDADEGNRVGMPPPSSIALYLVHRWLDES